jgi:MFS family permease
MTTLLVALAGLVAVASAVRSTWSPCGWSMLSTITPLAEQSRGHRYRTTALWFVVGGAVGGITLGLGAALLAAVVGWIGVPISVALGIAAVAAVVTGCSDLQLLGFRIPGTVRQVNEVWLGRYRSWVYGSGFGWQVGVGLATFLMTAGVYLVVVLAALTGSPLVALAICTLFGFVRGLAILLGASIATPDELVAFHRKFDHAAEPVRRAVIAVQFVAAATFAAVTWSVLVPIVGAAVITAVALATTSRRAAEPAATT